MMKKVLSLLMAFVLILSLAACGGNTGTSKEETGSSKTVETPAASGKSIVVYFSRTGEQDKVGVIEKGNTKIVAEMIAEKVGADTFEIVPKNDNYPMTFDALCDVAKEEQSNNARPEIKDTVKDFDSYGTVYLGYPIWWTDLPMICYTFLESYDFNGKTIVPFCTHEGSADADTQKKIQDAVPKATVKEVLAIRGRDAQNNQDEVKKQIEDWLK